MKKLRFLLVLPLAAAAWVGAAALGPAPATAADASFSSTPPAKAQGRIGTISWVGNTFLSAKQLNEALGLKPGDAYDAQVLARKLQGSLDGSGQGTDVTSRYMDHGYLFFQIDPVATPQPDGSTNLLFKIAEGRQARIGTITVSGNQKTPTADIIAMLPLHSGDLFSRTNLLASQRALFESGRFQKDNPTTKEFEGIRVNPQPVPRPDEATDVVNIAWVVTEK